METSPDNDFSFDIIECLPEEICDNIFANFNCRDLLKASLVSTEWNKFIGKSAVCMQKLKLEISSGNFERPRLGELLEEVEEILMNSNRKYENLELNDLKFINSGKISRSLLTCGRQWKKVTMRYLDFPTEVNFINLIAIIKPFVEELKMTSVDMLRDNPASNSEMLKLSEQQTKSLTFPNLKFLEVNGCNDSVIVVFQDVITLTELNLRIVLTSSINAIQKMFRCNKGLKKLVTSFMAFEEIFCGEILKDITFKLTLLEVQVFTLVDLSYALQPNFQQFLELHMKTLESLSLDIWMGLESVKMIFHMPKLKHILVRLYGFQGVDETLDWKETSFKQSLSLTSIDLLEFELNINQLRAFISATPNVKKLTLRTINDEKIACISELLPNLESFSVTWFRVHDVTDKTYLPNLKELSMKYYFLPIKESEAEEDRSQFESLFLAEKMTAEAFE